MGWAEEYRPKRIKKIYGNDKACKKLVEWANNWEPGDGAVILYGPPGVGKTTAAYAVANDNDWEVVEMNASEKRTRTKIESIAGSASENASLTGNKRRLIIVDEADNFHGNYDRGGSKAISEIVTQSQQPIILLANDLYGMSRSLRNKCTQIEFDYVDEKEIAKALRDICELQGVEYDIETLRRIASLAEGDVRSAINDLQAVASGNDSITDVSLLESHRDQAVGIFPFLDSLFKENTAYETSNEVQQVDETPDSLIRWIDENVFKVYSDEEVKKAYDFLAKADVWLGRTRKTQEYRYWRYASATMSSGVSAARSKKKSGWTRYSPPKWLSRDATKEEVARKIAVKAGTSTQTALHSILPFLSVMTHHCKNRGLTVRMAAYYDFDAEEVATVTGSGKTTNKVQDIIEDAKDLQTENVETFFALSETQSKQSRTQDDSTEDKKTSGENEKDNKGETSTDTQQQDTEEETAGDSNDTQTGLNEFM